MLPPCLLQLLITLIFAADADCTNVQTAATIRHLRRRPMPISSLQ